jgi:Protein of unknown function (DUF1569)
MALPNIFNSNTAENVIARIDTLTPQTTASWGKMNASQMLAHCNVTYELAMENKHKKPGALLKFIFKVIVKKKVVTEMPYQHNGKTAPEMIIKGERNFSEEKNRLVSYIRKAQSLGESYFDNKESHAFGKLSKTEWSNLFYKHLNHHLTQFGA